VDLTVTKAVLHESHMGVSKDEWDNAHLFNSDDTLFKVLLSLCGMGMATSQRFFVSGNSCNRYPVFLKSEIRYM
jgi:hypothetical protein